MLRSDVCDYSDAYIVARGRITVIGDNDAKIIKKLIFKNNVPFRSCKSNINNPFIDNAVDLDIIMSMYNLLECTDNYSMTLGILSNYYRDEINDSGIENNIDGNKINNAKIITSKTFEYKTKIIGRTPNDSNTLEKGVAVHLNISVVFEDFSTFYWLTSK